MTDSLTLEQRIAANKDMAHVASVYEDTLATRDAEIDRLKAAGDALHKLLSGFRAVVDGDPMTAKVQKALTQWKETQS